MENVKETVENLDECIKGIETMLITSEYINTTSPELHNRLNRLYRSLGTIKCDLEKANKLDRPISSLMYD